ncbi:hypothetical protein B0H34DRAFT_800352 [Crassisporium funariophilum]|nr:hypothetical protein B0H34DRAFT_800352 [Crassisporium funariophilum]
MSHYPYRHSTYFTQHDAQHTSELPVRTAPIRNPQTRDTVTHDAQPMNSVEDVIQEMFMRDRETVYAAPQSPNGFKKILRFVKNWKRNSDTSYILFPKSIGQRF